MAQANPAIDSMKKHTLLFYLLLLLLLPATAFASVGLTSFFTQVSGDTITIIWETESEIQNVGYNVYRTEENAAQFSAIVNKVRVNNRPIAPAGESGGRYTVTDATAAVNTTYYYWLEDIDTSSDTTYHGPTVGRIERGSVINPNATATPVPTTANDGTTPTLVPTEQATTPSGGATATSQSPANTPTTASTTQSDPTATSAVATATSESGRVFITPPASGAGNPTVTPSAVATNRPIPTSTPDATGATPQPPAQIGGQTNAPTATVAQPTTDNSSSDTQPTTNAVVPSTVDSNSNTLADEPLESASDEGNTTENDAPNQIGEAVNSDSGQPTGEVTAIDPETETVVDSELIPQSPTEVAISELAGSNSSPNEFSEQVTDVQQPSVVQPETNDNGVFLWFGLVAGGLLILVGTGFALLFFGNRNR